MDVNSLQRKIKDLEQKVNESVIPNDLKERIEEEIAIVEEGLKTGGFAGFENLSNYIRWVISLPFEKQTEDMLDLNIVKQVLDKNHYGLQGVKDRILEYISSLILNAQNLARRGQNKTGSEKVPSPILCLVGLVGTGKTTLAHSIAEALNKKFARIAFGGIELAATIRGQSRMIADAEPGLVIKSLVNTQSRNPTILLDELDRATEKGKADIMGVLVELLDSEQNKAFIDHYIDYPFDLSDVLFIATANNTTNISPAVLDRLEIIKMPSYTDEEKIAIAKNYLFPKTRQQTGMLENQISIDEDVWPIIIRPLGFDPGMRSLERAIGEICRKGARMIVEGKAQSIEIKDENVREFLPT